jgi:two-component system, LytTR family, sensor histidine kinase AlgZ
MTASSQLLERARPGIYALGAVAGAALVSSTLLLLRSGATPGTAVIAALPPSLLLGAIGVASRFICRAMPLRNSSFSRLLAAHAGSAAAASGIWIAAWNGWLAVMPAPRIAPNLSLLIVIGVLIYAATVTVQYLLLEVDASREAEQAALRYQILAREAELRAFKAQVDPHFLFNSLNAVASLCGSNPQQAREMAQRLADFFRLMLRVGKLEQITLREELDLVSRYLAIEKVRFGPRLDVRMTVDDSAAECFVPPLLLQPLVENAVRHGIASVVEGGVLDIGATLSGGRLRIWIDNPADPDRAEARGEGIGLQNARGRLQAAFDGQALLRAEESAGNFRVHIELPR